MDQQDNSQDPGQILQMLFKKRQQDFQNTAPAQSPQDPSQAQGYDSRPATQVTGNHDYAGLCQAYAEQQTYGHSGIFPTAAAAWQKYSQSGKAKSGLAGVKPGDLVYFTPDQSNGGNGHVGIYEGDKVMQSATNNGVRMDNINSWTQSTGQKVLGYVDPKAGGK